MNLKRIYAIIIRQLFLLRKNFTRFVNIFLWIALDVILWGFITQYLNNVSKAEFSFVPAILGAVILWGFLVRVQQGVILSFFEDMWSQNFLNLFASPIKTTEYILGLIGASIITSVAGLSFITVIASVAFNYNLLAIGLPLLLFLLVMFIFGLALGIITISFTLRFGPAGEWLAWIFPFLLGPLSGIIYPISILPNILQIISKIIPPSYVFEGLREIVFKKTFSPELLITGALIAFIYLFLSYLIFVYTFKIVKRKGLLARFSSEG
mgnify:CR=1 FL=1